MSGSLVRFYNECVVSNASTGTSNASCTPVTAPSAYNFGPKGSCSVKASAVHQDPCDGDPANPCNDVKLVVKCTDIHQSGGALINPGVDGGWKLRVGYRATIADMGGDMTIVDNALDFDLTTTEGKLTLNGTPVFDAMVAISSILDAEYIGPLNVQIVDVQLRDPAANVFAVLGMSSGS